MMTRRSTLLSAASLLVALACGPAATAEFATKEEAIAMVKNAMAFIKERGPEKAYAEFTNKGGR
jgi:cytochrome c